MNKKNILTLISLLSCVSLTKAASLEQLEEMAASSKVTSPATSSTTKSVTNFLSFKDPDFLSFKDPEEFSGIQNSQPTDETDETYKFARALTCYDGTSTQPPIPEELKPYEENPGQNDKPLFVLPNWAAFKEVEDAITTPGLTPRLSFLVETPSATSKTQLPNQQIGASCGNLSQQTLHIPN